MIIKTYLLPACSILLSIALNAQIEEIKQILESKEKSEETAIWLCDTAYTFHRNEPLIAERIAKLGLEIGQEIGSELASAKANHVLGISFWIRDEYHYAIEAYLEALKHYERLDNARGIALINMNVGIIYSDLGQEEKAIPYYLESEEPFTQLKDSVNLGRLYLNIGASYKNMGGNDKLASDYYHLALNVRLGIQDSVGVASALNNIAIVYLEKDSIPTLENSREASKYLNDGLDFLKKEKDIRLYSILSVNIGRCFIGLRRYTEAEKYLDQALKIALEKDFKVIEKWCYKYKSLLHSELKNHQKAYRFYRMRTELDNEIRGIEINKEIEELSIKYETAKKEKQLAELEKQNAIDKGIRNLLITGTTAVLILSSLIVFYVVQKRKRDRIIAKIKIQKMSDEVTAKNKEIASFTMSFLQKNQLMEELKEQINELKKTSDISTNKELSRINRIVDNTFKSDEEWKTFQITFDQMHDGFFKDLKQAFPEISNAELKLCALLRLNMNLKESAKILGIASDSVKTARYRLRKKLGLKTEDNLVDFLIQFENKIAS